MIVGAVLLAVLIAYVIVKYLPLKLRWIPSVLLLLVAILLGVKIFNGIMQPILFAEEKVKRYKPVVKSLKIVRDAEIKYYEVTGKYTKDKAGLIQFIDTAQLALTETKTIVQTVNKGSKWAPIMVEEEVRVTDTIGFEPVLKYFKDREYKTMFKVPGVEGAEFELETAEVEKVQGLIVPTFRARTSKEGVLKGLNKSLVKQELEAMESIQIKGEYVSVGSLEEVSTGGNWPPSYDRKDGAEK
tara:strand:- start:16827 stop:17552 length:726 start_codon:yes stop_codon:yes gene_type:complete